MIKSQSQVKLELMQPIDDDIIEVCTNVERLDTIALKISEFPN